MMISLSFKIDCKDRQQQICVHISWFVFLSRCWSCPHISSLYTPSYMISFLTVYEREIAGLTLRYCLCVASFLLPVLSSLSQRFNFSPVTSVTHTESARPSAATDTDLYRIKSLIKTPDAVERFSFGLRSQTNCIYWLCCA